MTFTETWERVKKHAAHWKNAQANSVEEEAKEQGRMANDNGDVDMDRNWNELAQIMKNPMMKPQLFEYAVIKGPGLMIGRKRSYGILSKGKART